MPVARGFLFSGLHAGIKPFKKDLALVFSEAPCSVAAALTINKAKAAPIEDTARRVPAAGIRAILINSGNANACTGRRGLDDARASTRLVAERLGCDESAVLVCSTGVIGRHLPMETLSTGIPKAVSTLDASADAFEAASARPIFSFFGQRPPADLIIMVTPGVRALVQAAGG